MDRLLEILQKAVKMEKEYDIYLNQKEKYNVLEKEMKSIIRDNSNLKIQNKRLESALFYNMWLVVCNECCWEWGFESEEWGHACDKCWGMWFIKSEIK